MEQREKLSSLINRYLVNDADAHDFTAHTNIEVCEIKTILNDFVDYIDKMDCGKDGFSSAQLNEIEKEEENIINLLLKQTKK